MQDRAEGLLRDKTRKSATPQTSEEKIRKLAELALSPSPDVETHCTMLALAKAVGIALATARGLREENLRRSGAIHPFGKSGTQSDHIEIASVKSSGCLPPFDQPIR